MQKKIKKNVSPRVFEETQEFYGQIFESINAGAEFILEAFPGLYQRTIHDLKGKFTRGELMLMIDVMNGTAIMPQHSGFTIGANVADGIALDHLGEKWKVEAWPLNKKMADLTNFDRACLELWALAFWSQDDHSNIEEYVGTMV